jgi:hypothetical protein
LGIDLFVGDIDTGEVRALTLDQIFVDHVMKKFDVALGGLFFEKSANFTFLPNITESNDVPFYDGDHLVDDFSAGKG